jgi:hypothetical protein
LAIPAGWSGFPFLAVNETPSLEKPAPSTKDFPLPTSPAVIKSIRLIRKILAGAPPKTERDAVLVYAVWDLFRHSWKIAQDPESLDAILALAPEIEAFRGKGSQFSAREFFQALSFLVFSIKERLPSSESDPDTFLNENEMQPSSKDVIDMLEILAADAFRRVQGPPVRSRHAGELRAIAWDALRRITDIFRRPDHLAMALKVAADTRASLPERNAAVEFTVAYWQDDDPDEATFSMLENLAENQKDRHLLVTVLKAQIDFGINDEFGALCAVGDWDDAND